MLTVTQEAAGLIMHTLGQEDTAEGAVVRLVIDNNELQVAIDQEVEGDFVVEADGKPILVMDQDLADALGAAPFDAEMTEDGPMLTLTQPEPEDGVDPG